LEDKNLVKELLGSWRRQNGIQLKLSSYHFLNSKTLQQLP
jgi:hypothetical protein